MEPMEQAERQATVEAIHASATMLVLAVAGGGNAVITDLLAVPGASRTVLEARVPYAETALAELLEGAGVVVESTAGAVSQAMAEAMASACRVRAERLAPGHHDLIGVGVTAALVTDRTRKGDHRAHLAVATADGLHHVRVGLKKGERSRVEEDRVVADAVLRAIAAHSTA